MYRSRAPPPSLSTYINDLRYSHLKLIADQLDYDDSWKEIVGLIMDPRTGDPLFTNINVGMFERVGQKQSGSSSREMLNSWGTQLATVEDLLCVLKEGTLFHAYNKVCRDILGCDPSNIPLYFSQRPGSGGMPIPGPAPMTQTYGGGMVGPATAHHFSGPTHPHIVPPYSDSPLSPAPSYVTNLPDSAPPSADFTSSNTSINVHSHGGGGQRPTSPFNPLHSQQQQSAAHVMQTQQSVFSSASQQSAFSISNSNQQQQPYNQQQIIPSPNPGMSQRIPSPTPGMSDSREMTSEYITVTNSPCITGNQWGGGIHPPPGSSGYNKPSPHVQRGLEMQGGPGSFGVQHGSQYPGSLQHAGYVNTPGEPIRTAVAGYGISGTPVSVVTDHLQGSGRQGSQSRAECERSKTETAWTPTMGDGYLIPQGGHQQSTEGGEATEKTVEDSLESLKINSDLFPYAELSDLCEGFSHLLGSGTYGEVFKGTRNGRAIAVKRFKTLEKSVVRQFVREAGALSNCQHSNILEIRGLSMDGPVCLMFDYMKFGSLESCLEKTSELYPLSWRQRVFIVDGACRGLEYLHSLTPKIIHRDVKSANILIGEGLESKVGDFGLAKTTMSVDTHTSTGVAAGSMGYMPPESLDGVVVDKGDTYSMGVVCLEILTGRKAYEHNVTGEPKTLKMYVIDMYEAEEDDEEMFQVLWDLSAEWISLAAHQLYSLSQKALNSNYRRRPTMTQMCASLTQMISSE